MTKQNKYIYTMVDDENKILTKTLLTKKEISTLHKAIKKYTGSDYNIMVVHKVIGDEK